MASQKPEAGINSTPSPTSSSKAMARLGPPRCLDFQFMHGQGKSEERQAEEDGPGHRCPQGVLPHGVEQAGGPQLAHGRCAAKADSDHVDARHSHQPTPFPGARAGRGQFR
ncbi:hypothetical protein AZSI13_25450 [Azospira sp. I13]|nr:hypothetical protein AZSI13_25450 [Azospira sp. I13]